MRSSNSAWVRGILSIIGFSLCLVFIVLTTGAANPTVQSVTVFKDAAAPGSPPVIQAFKANPMTLETPTSAAVYTFKVKGATNVTITEAGSLIRIVINPTGAALNGTVTGMPASSIPVDDSGKFKAVLTASNAAGIVKAELTLSFSEKLLASSQGDGETQGTDNQTDSRSPKWLDMYYSPFGPARSSQSGTAPTFYDCPSDCNYCLEPAHAQSQGMGDRCSSEPCYYSPDRQRNWYCYKPAPGWCCNKQNVSQSTRDECSKLGGAWFTNQSDAQDRCQVTGYCCQNGNITALTSSRCAQIGGTFYSDPVQAKERCQPIGYCCQNGKLTSLTSSQCAQAGGIYYSDAVQAKERCQPIGYCCQNGNVTSLTSSQCTQIGGTYYSDAVQAKELCQPTCYCCVQGKVVQTNQATCRQYGGNCYTSQAEALRYCQQQSTCYCCAYGKVFQSTQSQCTQNGGNCYESQSVAQRYCQQQSTCYCCAKGQVFQTTQSACTQSGGNCYDSQSVAQRYCQQESNCWCCVNGYVKYIPQSTCTQNGGRCYSSQAEATKNCRQINPPSYLK